MPTARPRWGAWRANPCTVCPAAASAPATTGPANPEAPVRRTRTAPRPAASDRTASTGAPLQTLEIGADHHLHQGSEVHAGRPPEHLPRLRGVADEQVDLGRPQQRGVLSHVGAPVETHDREGGG